jgi:hypothetical protein
MGADRRRKRIQKEQHAYVDRLRCYRNKGVAIFIDGKEADRERDWFKIFEVGEDGAVYMADYVNSEEGQLVEIHFDLVYLDSSVRQAWENQKRLEEMVRKAQMQHYKTILQQYKKGSVSGKGL